MVEGIYGRIGYLRREGEPGECKGSNRRVRKGIQKRYGRH